MSCRQVGQVQGRRPEGCQGDFDRPVLACKGLEVDCDRVASPLVRLSHELERGNFFGRLELVLVSGLKLNEVMVVSSLLGFGQEREPGTVLPRLVFDQVISLEDEARRVKARDLEGIGAPVDRSAELEAHELAVWRRATDQHSVHKRGTDAKGLQPRARPIRCFLFLF